jgi:hypothetical protein
VSKQSRTSIRLVAAIALLLVLAGCATKPPLTPGIYTTTITDEDVLSSDELGPVDRGFLPGKWELTFAEGGRYSLIVYWKGGSYEFGEGLFTLTENRIVFADEAGHCPGGQEVSTYQWAFDGKTLTLTSVEDACAYRNLVYASHPWSRQD